MNRIDYIRKIAANNFWGDMARSPQDRQPLDDEGWNSLFISCLVNRGIQWERAMGSATELGFVNEMKMRSGIHDTLTLFTINNDVLLEWLAFDDDGDYAAAGGRNGSLLRYRYTVEHCHQAMCRIRDEWGGSARFLHADEPTGQQFLQRVMSFGGYGAKTSGLYCRVAVLSHGVTLWDNYAGLDISPDRHCSRVMTRLGLVSEDASPQEVIDKARELSPYAPVEWDGLFIIGLDYCHASDPECSICALIGVCGSRC